MSKISMNTFFEDNHQYNEEQAVGRAHRIGQKNVVQVIRLIAQGTIEEKIYELQQSKKELIDTVLHSGDQALTKLTERDPM
jgi:SNF2 family DNA or RNA helicase